MNEESVEQLSLYVSWEGKRFGAIKCVSGIPVVNSSERHINICGS